LFATRAKCAKYVLRLLDNKNEWWRSEKRSCSHIIRHRSAGHPSFYTLHDSPLTECACASASSLCSLCHSTDFCFRRNTLWGRVLMGTTTTRGLPQPTPQGWHHSTFNKLVWCQSEFHCIAISCCPRKRTWWDKMLFCKRFGNVNHFSLFCDYFLSKTRGIREIMFEFAGYRTWATAWTWICIETLMLCTVIWLGHINRERRTNFVRTNEQRCITSLCNAHCTSIIRTPLSFCRHCHTYSVLYSYVRIVFTLSATK